MTGIICSSVEIAIEDNKGARVFVAVGQQGISQMMVTRIAVSLGANVAMRSSKQDGFYPGEVGTVRLDLPYDSMLKPSRDAGVCWRRLKEKT